MAFQMKHAVPGLVCIAALTSAAHGQTLPDALPAFEVASVKPAGPDQNMPMLNGPMGQMMRFRGGPGSKSPERIDYSGVTLKMLLERAWDVKPSQISGPGWLDTE